MTQWQQHTKVSQLKPHSSTQNDFSLASLYAVYIIHFLTFSKEIPLFLLPGHLLFQSAPVQKETRQIRGYLRLNLVDFLKIRSLSVSNWQWKRDNCGCVVNIAARLRGRQRIGAPVSPSERKSDKQMNERQTREREESFKCVTNVAVQQVGNLLLLFSRCTNNESERRKERARECEGGRIKRGYRIN